MNDLVQLVYLSTAVELFSSAALADLMTQAAANNAKAGITGILLYREGSFMQAIEGTDAAIEALFAKIASDPRHKHILKLMKTPIAQREFGAWSMALRDLDSPAVAQHPAFNPYLTTRLTPAEFAEHPTRVRKLLETFRSAIH